MAKIGRPSTYNKATADKIIEGISDNKSLRTICQSKDMPNVTTIFDWLGKHADFADRYTRAKADQAESGYEDIMRIEAKVEAKEIDPNAGRVLIDSIKWRLGKLRPQKYSDKHLVEHSTASDKSIKVEFVGIGETVEDEGK